MTAPRAPGGTLVGIALALGGYAAFAFQDAIVKWLVADYTVWQVLFLRSLVILGVSLVLALRQGTVRVFRSPNKGPLLLRAGLMVSAWLLYYGAARGMKLAELVTLYYAAPIFVVVLSVPFLGEKVAAARWLSVLVGFIGVVVVANPTERPDPGAALQVLLAALMWAFTMILARKITRSETTFNQMIFTSGAFLLPCAISLPWNWRAPDAMGLVLMLALGLVATAGQYLLFEAIRRAPASAIATTEYSGLVWAFLLGFAIWGDVPARNVFIGACVIAAASLGMVLVERRIGGKPA